MFAICFGRENAETICEVFDGNYVEMSVAIVPYIYDVILPRVNECIARRREQIKGIYGQGEGSSDEAVRAVSRPHYR